jgi:hypothetical protein
LLIDGLTSELEEQQQLLTELQQEHWQLRSSHDILVGYCDALEFGLELERARKSSKVQSCKGNSTAAAAAGSTSGVARQEQHNSLAGTGVVEQQLLAQLAQLHYSAQPLCPPPEIAAAQQQQQQQQELLQDDGEEAEEGSRKQSAQSTSSSTTTYGSSDAAGDNRICPPEDKFLLFRWLIAQVRAAACSCKRFDLMC